LKITTERNAAIDFSIPLMETGIGVIVALRQGAISTTAFLSKSKYFKLSNTIYKKITIVILYRTI